ncbi:MAG: Twin-arginine translocation pathway signal sequence domain-containing protein, partial [Pseudomonadota bacterium]
MTHSHNRRRLLQTIGSVAALPMLSLPGFVAAAGAKPSAGNILVLIELAGGNDGLNTLVPVKDSAYRALRPGIGISRRAALGLTSDFGLHPSMGPLADLWEAGALQVVQGVGYPNPNRSHFRSIEIWNAGRGAEDNSRDGWLATGFDGQQPGASDADGLVLGGSMGPMLGHGRFAAIRDEEMFIE